MVTATLHGGPRDGETFEQPWATPVLRLPPPVAMFYEPPPDRFVVREGGWDRAPDMTLTYRLRGPWRGQNTAEYDYEEPVEEAA